MTSTTKTRPVCPECGSHEVRADAYAEWDPDAQEWTLCNTYETYFCADCETDDISPNWEEIQ